MDQEKILEFEERIGYRFEHPDLLITALTHSSYSNEKRLNRYENNEGEICLRANAGALCQRNPIRRIPPTGQRRRNDRR